MTAFLRSSPIARRILVAAMAVWLPAVSTAQARDDAVEVDLAYRSADSDTPYMRERCKLDVYVPPGVSDFPTIVWFHGGGLSAGNKSIPKPLRDQGVAVVAANYRLHPAVKSPAYIDDAAAAVAWTVKNISHYGGDPQQVFVAGHSAGGYLTSMIGLDPSYLRKYDVDANQLAGLIPFSGHTITHFTVRKERGIDGKQPIIDEMAPLFHVRNDCPPLLLITGDRDTELLGRYEENAYMWRMMQEVGHPSTELYELEGYDHGGMPLGAYPLLLKFVRQQSKD